LDLKLTEHHSPGYVQTVKGEGMPLFEKKGFGDLYVEYNVVLPASLPTETRRSGSPKQQTSITADKFAELAEAFHGKDRTKDEL
jgi:DnaJ-related protein SCJ1